MGTSRNVLKKRLIQRQGVTLKTPDRTRVSPRQNARLDASLGIVEAKRKALNRQNNL